MLPRHLLILFFILCHAERAFCQSNTGNRDKKASTTKDSLLALLTATNIDTTRDRLHSVLLDVLEDGERAPYLEQLLKRSEAVLRSADPKEKKFGIYRRYLGLCHYHKAELAEKNLKNELAGNFYLRSLDVFRGLKDEANTAEIHRCLGKLYQNMGRVKESIAHLDTAVHVFEKLNKSEELSIALNYLAVSYGLTGDNESAKQVYLKNIALQRKIGYRKGEANTLINLGGMYFKNGNLEMAERYCREGMSISETCGFHKGVNEALNNLALIHFKQKKIQESLNDLGLVLKLAMETGDVRSEMKAYITRAKIHNAQNNIPQFKKDAEKAYALSKKINHLNLQTEAAGWMYKACKKSGDAKQALQYYEIYISNKDSLTNIENKKASMRSQIRYEYEKQAAADSVAHAKETDIKNAELKKQEAEINAKKNQQYALFGGLALVMVFAGFMYNRFKVTQKQKAIIEEQKSEVEGQKKLVEEKQKEILDSIQYAKRIQLAQIPSDKRVGSALSRLKS